MHVLLGPDVDEHVPYAERVLAEIFPSLKSPYWLSFMLWNLAYVRIIFGQFERHGEAQNDPPVNEKPQILA
jgi:hypothetical protein